MYTHLYRYVEADYYGADLYRKSLVTETGGSQAVGPGETVRLDHVMISRRDPHSDPATWQEQENVAFMAYIDRYAQDYKARRFFFFFSWPAGGWKLFGRSARRGGNGMATNT